ncbi:MAG TPA: MauE/DoxX family redox-associated membrane protein, partial [Chthonomonadales bacterium]|nr:MauE/DoxX family redox-associated membrane protein [Chthonomonadales bacterium]
AFISRLALGSVWLAAGRAKLRDRARLAAGVSRLTMLPESFTAHIAPALPWLEICLGSLLLAGLWSVAAAVASAALLLIFTILIGIHLVRKNPVPCSCFGDRGARPINWLSLVRNGFLLIAAVMLILPSWPYLSLDALRAHRLLPIQPSLWRLLPALLIAGAAWALIRLANDSLEMAASIATATGGPAAQFGGGARVKSALLRLGLMQKGL